MDWSAGRVTEEQVRWWALLMFTGAFQIDVNYSDDDVVNDVIFELKDLGEIVDGIITPAQRNEMIERLESSR